MDSMLFIDYWNQYSKSLFPESIYKHLIDLVTKWFSIKDRQLKLQTKMLNLFIALQLKIRPIIRGAFRTQSNIYNSTAWKVSKYGVFFGPYFPVFGPEKTLYMDTFYAVWSFQPLTIFTKKLHRECSTGL